MRIRPTHATAILKPRPDIHAEVLGWLKRGEVIDNPIWGRVPVGPPIRYQMTAKRDNFAFGEVLALGEGSPFGSGMDKPEVSVGDIVGFDLCQVGHELADGSWSMLWKQLICRFDPGNLVPVPLSSWVLTRADDILMHRFAMGDSLSGIHRPGSALVTGGKASSRVRLTCEAVEAVGPGRFVKKVFLEAGCKVGDGAVFMPMDAVHIALPERGHMSFVRWDDVEFVLEAV